eukprot:2686447-Rhodomonas_salina.2
MLCFSTGSRQSCEANVESSLGGMGRNFLRLCESETSVPDCSVFRVASTWFRGKLSLDRAAVVSWVGVPELPVADGTGFNSGFCSVFWTLMFGLGWVQQKKAAALYTQAGDYQKTARFYYKKAEDTYYQANNWASYDDWRRARDQWDYFYSRNR